MNDYEKFKSDLDTPCLILDLDILEKNLATMQDTVWKSGKNIRPHAKTHKCSELAKLQVEKGAIGICAAKISEAEVLVRAGIKNVLITGPVTTKIKTERLINLIKSDPSIKIVVDNLENISSLDSAFHSQNISADVLMDIDVGLLRTGVNPAEAMSLAKEILASRCLHLVGVQAYAGHVQHIPSLEERAQVSKKCLEPAIKIFNDLQDLTADCKIFSVSGTGTFDLDSAIPEVTEFQVGSYVCMDAEYLGIEYDDSKEQFAPSLRLLTTVISVNQKSFVTVDAGLKALYQDAGKPFVVVPENSGLTYDWFGDEYGRISHTDFTSLPKMGEVLELVTSHCDPTINLFDKYYLTRGEKVVGTWRIDLRGCCQ